MAQSPPPPTQNRVTDNRGLMTLPWLTYLRKEPAFTDRGDPANADLSLTTVPAVVVDGAFHEWDLSGIVPPGITAVLIRVQIFNAGASCAVLFRKKGHVNNWNLARVDAAINAAGTADRWVACDSDRKIEYLVGNVGAYGILSFLICGWLR